MQGVGPIDFCITQLKAQGPSRTCNESKEEEEKGLGQTRSRGRRRRGRAGGAWGLEGSEPLMCSGSEAGSYLRLIDFVYHSPLGSRVIKKTKKVRVDPPVSQSLRLGFLLQGWEK